MASVGDYVIRTIDINGQEVAVQMSADLQVGDYCFLTRDVNGRLVALKPGGAGAREALLEEYTVLDSPSFSTSFTPSPFGGWHASGYKMLGDDKSATQNETDFRQAFYELDTPVASGDTIRLYITRVGQDNIMNSATDSQAGGGSNLRLRVGLAVSHYTDDSVDLSTLTWATRPAISDETSVHQLTKVFEAGGPFRIKASQFNFTNNYMYCVIPVTTGTAYGVRIATSSTSDNITSDWMGVTNIDAVTQIIY